MKKGVVRLNVKDDNAPATSSSDAFRGSSHVCGGSDHLRAPAGALRARNIAKSRPKPPFDLNRNLQHGGGQNNNFRFSPPEGFKLTPFAQKHFDDARAAQAAGKVYQDDIGNAGPPDCP